MRETNSGSRVFYVKVCSLRGTLQNLSGDERKCSFYKCKVEATFKGGCIERCLGVYVVTDFDIKGM